MTNYPLCVVDQRPVHDAGKLCPACWADLEHDLSEVFASLADDLDITLAGLGRTGGSPIGIVVRSASRGVGFDERAGDLARQLHNALGTWVRVIHEELPPIVECSLCHVDQRRHAEGPEQRPRVWHTRPQRLPADRTDYLAAWLGDHERSVRRHEAVGELWQEVHDLVEQVRRVVDRRPDRCYLGVCSVHLDTLDGGGDAHPGFPPQPIYCDADLYAIDGDAYVTCRSCGALHHVAERRRVLLDSVDNQLGTGTEIARALAAYADLDLSLARLGMWANRGRIAVHPPREGERGKRYRVGDVRDLLDPDRGAPLDQRVLTQVDSLLT